jgi:hypothetical protein
MHAQCSLRNTTTPRRECTQNTQQRQQTLHRASWYIARIKVQKCQQAGLRFYHKASAAQHTQPRKAYKLAGGESQQDQQAFSGAQNVPSQWLILLCMSSDTLLTPKPGGGGTHGAGVACQAWHHTSKINTICTYAHAAAGVLCDKVSTTTGAAVTAPSLITHQPAYVSYQSIRGATATDPLCA